MPPPVIHLIPHVHWDREWYLPLGGFRARFVAMVDDLIDRFAADPGFPPFLLDGQTALLEDYLGVRPERRAQLSDLIAAGKLQTGPWYILADEQIPAGESLLRNLQLGRDDSTALGARLRVAYSPDAFGHPASFPLVAREFGLPTAVVWRGLGPGATGGKDLAWWEGQDGRRVLVHHLPAEGYEIGSNLLVPDVELADAWRRVAAAVLPRSATGQVAVFVGADHHAAHPDLHTLARRLGQVDRSVTFRFSRLDEFLEAAAREAGSLASITGELRWSYGYTWTLQGVHGTRAPLKRRHAQIELLLTRLVEPLLATTPAAAGAAARAVLARAWREVVQCQFHDVLGGCSADPVARAALVRLDDAEAAGRELARVALHAHAGHDPDRAGGGVPTRARLLVWNGAARARGGVVIGEASFFNEDILVGPPGGRRPRKGPGFAPFGLSVPGGGTLAPQVLRIARGTERRDAARHYPDQDLVDVARFAIPLPSAIGGLSSRLFEVTASPGEAHEPFAAAYRRALWNGRVGATVEPAGTLTLENPATGAVLEGLARFESELDRGDSYSFAPVRGDRAGVPSRRVRPSVTAAGPLVAGLSWRVSLAAGKGASGGAGRVQAEVELEAVGDSPVLRLGIGLDNQGRDHRLRLRFPTGLRRASLLAGAQFGAVSRETPTGGRGGAGMERPVPTAPAHRWVATASGDQGLALFAPGFFEYEWTRTGDLLITLLRAVGELSRGDLGTRPGHAGWPTPIPEAQCPGRELIQFGLAPITARELAAPDRLDAWWEDTFVPLEARWIRDATVLPPAGSTGIELTGEGLSFSAALPGAEPGEIVLRCYNTRTEPVAGSWRVGRRIRRARRTRADGTVLRDLAVMAADDRSVSFVAGGGELVTVAVNCEI